MKRIYVIYDFCNCMMPEAYTNKKVAKDRVKEINRGCDEEGIVEMWEFEINKRDESYD